MLDTESMEWFVPTVEGNPPSSRAGHAAAALGSMWYIIGGGNNTSGRHAKAPFPSSAPQIPS